MLTRACPQLPWISFRLDEGGELVHVPLADLVLPEAGGQRELCMERFDAGTFHVGAASRDLIAVAFGAMALRSLFVAVDMQSGRVGMAQSARTDAQAAAASFVAGK